MKNRIVFMLLITLVFSTGLWAQGSGQDFFKTIGLVYTISTAHGDNKSVTQSMGLTANFFVFSNENLGYYINPGIGLRMKQGAQDLENMDMYFGAVFGPAFRIHDGGKVDILAGIGPDILCIVHLGEFANETFNSTKTSLGIGLGGSIEGRLKLYNNIAFTGGILMKYNFAPYQEDRTFIASPYIGVGF
ncbi:MAG: hypothetical protein LBQ67_01985 [Treponema sp.]|jgi:hypothetical protein|nr:hypothetical protein [Treponema sp.]